jgi:hypothetical protein
LVAAALALVPACGVDILGDGQGDNPAAGGKADDFGLDLESNENGKGKNIRTLPCDGSGCFVWLDVCATVSGELQPAPGQWVSFHVGRYDDVMSLEGEHANRVYRGSVNWPGSTLYRSCTEGVIIEVPQARPGDETDAVVVYFHLEQEVPAELDVSVDSYDIPRQDPYEPNDTRDEVSEVSSTGSVDGDSTEAFDDWETVEITDATLHDAQDVDIYRIRVEDGTLLGSNLSAPKVDLKLWRVPEHATYTIRAAYDCDHGTIDTQPYEWKVSGTDSSNDRYYYGEKTMHISCKGAVDEAGTLWITVSSETWAPGSKPYSLRIHREGFQYHGLFY